MKNGWMVKMVANAAVDLSMSNILVDNLLLYETTPPIFCNTIKLV